jgi:hypothetical protein
VFKSLNVYRFYNHLKSECKYTTVKEALSSVLVFIFTNPLIERDSDYATIEFKRFLPWQSLDFLNLPKNLDTI